MHNHRERWLAPRMQGQAYRAYGKMPTASREKLKELSHEFYQHLAREAAGISFA